MRTIPLSFSPFRMGLTAAAVAFCCHLSALQAADADKTNPKSLEDRFIEEAHSCVVKATTPNSQNTSVKWLALDCLTVTTAKATPPVLIPGPQGFEVQGSEAFIVHSMRPLFSVGLKCSVPPGGTPLKIELQQRTGGTNATIKSLVFTPNTENGGFFSARSDTAFNEVSVSNADGIDLPVKWERIHIGCQPLLQAPEAFAGASKRADFFQRTLATSVSGPLGVQVRLPQPQGEIPADSGNTLHMGGLGLRGANGDKLRIGDKALIGELLPGHPVYDKTVGLMAGVEMSSDSSSGENFDACLDAPATAFGFDVVEISEKLREHYPTDFPKFTGAGITQVPSTFTITLYHGTTQIGGPFLFQPEPDVPSFWGVISPQPFSRVEIRETVGGPDNELFGQFFTTTCGCCCGDKSAGR